MRTTSRAAMACSKLAHRLLHIATGLAVLAAAILAGAAWRLAQGPVEVGWLADRLNVVLRDESAPVRATFESASLAWEGFQSGSDYPLDLRLTHMVLSDPTGRTVAEAPDAHVTFSLASLVMGRIVPRTIEVDHARVALTRAADGSIGPNGEEADNARPQPADMTAIRSQLMHPAASDRQAGRGFLEQINRVHFREASVLLNDRTSGLEIRSPALDIDVRRLRTGIISGSMEIPIVVGERTVAAKAGLTFTPGGDMVIEAAISPFRPANIPSLPTTMAGVDLPLSGSGVAKFDRDLRLQDSSVDIHIGSGSFAVGQGRFPIRSGEVSLTGTPDRITVSAARLNVARAADGPQTAVTLNGEIRRTADRIVASINLGASQVDLADLSRLWPQGVGGGARGWILQNVSGGLVQAASGTFVIESDPSLRDVALTKAVASANATEAAFTWIQDVPPVEQADVHFTLSDPDIADITIPMARQRIRGAGDLIIRDSRMKITGLARKDQFATIRVGADGPMTSVLALLKEPRLRLLSSHPIGLKPTGGDTSATMDFQLPLDDNLQIEDVAIHAEGHIRHARIPNAVAGRDMEDAAYDLTVDKNGLTMKGRGLLAGIPTILSGGMDFTPGAPDQVVRKVELTAEPSSAQLDAAGLRVSDIAEGVIPLKATYVERRDGNNTIALNGNLSEASLLISPLAWRKPAGINASASAVLMMTRDRMSKIDRIVARGPGLDIAGSVEYAGGQPQSVRFDMLRLGRTEARGLASLGQTIALELRGNQIDLAPKLTERSSQDSSPPSPATKPSWTLDARFDRALMANDIQATDFTATAGGDGETIRMLDASGTFGATTGFTVRIDPSLATRRLHVESSDAGRFFSAIDTTRRIEGGHLVIDGTFETPIGYRPLAGTMNVTDARIRNSPILGRLLQAITLYGLIDALRGPGMVFTHIIAPFRYAGSGLFLNQARAFNPSLGLTAQGSIDLRTQRTAIKGTIVPAYFFNTLLGHLPLVGRLFSPEIGGGVFAVRYGLEGPTEEPSVSINPISGLTPGFMREIFGMFGKQEGHP